MRYADDLSYTSGFLSTASSGGAVVPVLSGTLADHFGIAAAFTIPSVAYPFIAMCVTIFFPSDYHLQNAYFVSCSSLYSGANNLRDVRVPRTPIM
jgi:fucose permease